MPTPADIKLQVVLNGGAPQTGVVAAAFSDQIVLKVDNTAGVKKAKYRIYEYPEGFTCPAGWTAGALAYELTIENGGPTPAFSLPATNADLSGQYLFDVEVNDRKRDGKRASDLYDNSTLVEIPFASSALLKDVAYLIDKQADSKRGWAGSLKRLIRYIDQVIISPGGTGDFVGPAGATDDNLVVFNGATGKNGRDSNVKKTTLTYGIVDDARHYAVLMTGLTDNASPLQAAVTGAAALTGKLRIPKGTVRIDSGIVLPSDFELELAEGCTIDMSHAPAQTVAFSAAGTEGSSQALTVNASKDGSTVTVASAVSYAQGDLVRLKSNAIFDASNTSSKIGEINKVASVSGGVITLETPLRADYLTADSATITKITPAKNIKITGGRILGGGTLTTAGSDADHVGVKFLRGQNLRVEGVTFERTDLIGCWFQDCVEFKAHGCTMRDFVNDGLAYGFSVDNACQEGVISGNHFYRVRHSFTTANSTDTQGITRRVKFIGNQVWSTTPARAGSGGDAIDTHGGAEDIEILNNTVHSSSGGGINVECASCEVQGNKIFNTADYGIIYHNETDLEGECAIQGNRIVKAGSEAIRVNMPTRGSVAPNKSVLVANNRIKNCGGIGIYIVNSVGSVKSEGVSVTGNVLRGVGSASASIYLEDVNGASVTGNTIHDPVNAAQQCILLRDCTNWTVAGNAIRHKASATGIGIYINASSAGSCKGGSITGNTVGGTTPVSLRGVVMDNNAQDVSIGTNDFTACNTQFTRGTGSGHDIPADVTLSVTIASDAVTINRNTRELIVDTEAAAATDNLATISGGVAGQVIGIRTNSSSRDVTVKDGTGNILSGADFTLATGDDLTFLMFTSSNHWRRVANATN